MEARIIYSTRELQGTSKRSIKEKKQSGGQEASAGRRKNMKEWKNYNELTAEQQEQVKELIRQEWLQDARWEAEHYPDDEVLPEIIEHLESNDEMCASMIEDQLEPENEMFRRAMRQVCQG